MVIIITAIIMTIVITYRKNIRWYSYQISWLILSLALRCYRHRCGRALSELKNFSIGLNSFQRSGIYFLVKQCEKCWQWWATAAISHGWLLILLKTLLFIKTLHIVPLLSYGQNWSLHWFCGHPAIYSSIHSFGSSSTSTMWRRSITCLVVWFARLFSKE